MIIPWRHTFYRYLIKKWKRKGTRYTIQKAIDQRSVNCWLLRFIAILNLLTSIMQSPILVYTRDILYIYIRYAAIMNTVNMQYVHQSV